MIGTRRGPLLCKVNDGGLLWSPCPRPADCAYTVKRSAVRGQVCLRHFREPRPGAYAPRAGLQFVYERVGEASI